MPANLKTLTCVVSLLMAGCGDSPQIREYVLEPERERIVTSEVLRNQFPVIPFRWSVPKEWRSSANDQFSVVAWAAGPKDSPDEARITLSELPAAAGLEAQVARWRGQIGIAEPSSEDAMKDVQQLKIGDQSGSWIELQGARETILGFIVISDQKMWVLKYRSTNGTARDQRDVFRGFSESMRIEKTRRS